MTSNSISVSVNLDPALDTAESNYLPLQNLCPGGQTEVTDARHKKVYDTVKWYDVWNDPVGLKKRLENLVDPEKTDFTTHRDKIHLPGLPKTAGLITNLLRAYPKS